MVNFYVLGVSNILSQFKYFVVLKVLPPEQLLNGKLEMMTEANLME